MINKEVTRTERTAVCPGSFDPVTVGHMDIINRAAKLFDRVIVAVIRNSAKKPVISVEERLELLRLSIADIPNAEVCTFNGLLARYCQEVGACAIVKGIRGAADYESEMVMALANRELCPGLETVLMTASTEYSYVSSSLVREVAMYGGDISPFVPEAVLERVYKALNRA